MSNPTAILLIGIPAAGKSTFYRQRYFSTHLRISLDMLKTRNREMLIFSACLSARQSLVIDDTNATRAVRSRFITSARSAGYRVVGYYFRSAVAEALERNRRRSETDRISEKGIMGIAGRLELPAVAEGFDELWYVRCDGEGGFVVEEWHQSE